MVSATRGDTSCGPRRAADEPRSLAHTSACTSEFDLLTCMVNLLGALWGPLLRGPLPPGEVICIGAGVVCGSSAAIMIVCGVSLGDSRPSATVGGVSTDERDRHEYRGRLPTERDRLKDEPDEEAVGVASPAV